MTPLEILKKICSDSITNGLKIIIGFDSEVKIDDLFVTAWQCLSNIDPVRDCFVMIREPKLNNCLLVDATSKTLQLNNFKRPWPNVTVSKKETVDNINNRWMELFDFNIIESPSEKYYSLVKGEDAIAFKNDFK